MPRTKPARAPRSRYQARIDGKPHRSWSSINARRGDKLRFDIILAHESAEAGRELSQWDGFSKLIEAYLKEAEGRLPRDVIELLAAPMIDERAEWGFFVGEA
jgi:hypothetical protein